MSDFSETFIKDVSNGIEQTLNEIRTHEKIYTDSVEGIKNRAKLNLVGYIQSYFPISFFEATMEVLEQEKKLMNQGKSQGKIMHYENRNLSVFSQVNPSKLNDNLWFYTHPEEYLKLLRQYLIERAFILTPVGYKDEIKIKFKDKITPSFLDSIKIPLSKINPNIKINLKAENNGFGNLSIKPTEGTKIVRNTVGFSIPFFLAQSLKLSMSNNFFTQNDYYLDIFSNAPFDTSQASYYNDITQWYFKYYQTARGKDYIVDLIYYLFLNDSRIFINTIKKIKNYIDEDLNKNGIENWIILAFKDAGYEGYIQSKVAPIVPNYGNYEFVSHIDTLHSFITCQLKFEEVKPIIQDIDSQFSLALDSFLLDCQIDPHKEDISIFSLSVKNAQYGIDFFRRMYYNYLDKIFFGYQHKSPMEFITRETNIERLFHNTNKTQKEVLDLYDKLGEEFSQHTSAFQNLRNSYINLTIDAEEHFNVIVNSAIVTSMLLNEISSYGFYNIDLRSILIGTKTIKDSNNSKYILVLALEKVVKEKLGLYEQNTENIDNFLTSLPEIFYDCKTFYDFIEKLLNEVKGLSQS